MNDARGPSSESTTAVSKKPTPALPRLMEVRLPSWKAASAAALAALVSF
jgi:hypothetical protein